MKLFNNQLITVGDTDFADAYGISRLDLEVASDSVPYVAFNDHNSRKAKVMKFDGSEWVVVGDSVSVGEAGATMCLTLVNGTTPYVSYIDNGNSYRAVVKKLESEEVCADSHAQYSLGNSKLLIPLVDPETHEPTGEITVFKAKLQLKNGNFILNRVWDAKAHCH